MGFIIGLLTLVMVLDCMVLILLVLVQLPKKEAGVGVAFGGAATDALFGAGKGNVLTNITKYAATAFFVLALLLGILQSKFHNRSSSNFLKNISEAGHPAAGAPLPASPPSTTPVAPAPSSAVPLTATNLLQSAPPVESTNLPVAPGNPSPAK